MRESELESAMGMAARLMSQLQSMRNRARVSQIANAMDLGLRQG